MRKLPPVTTPALRQRVRADRARRVSLEHLETRELMTLAPAPVAVDATHGIPAPVAFVQPWNAPAQPAAAAGAIHTSSIVKQASTTITVAFTNAVPNLKVSFAVFGDGAPQMISPNTTRTLNVVTRTGQTPFVRIYQVGGGSLDFSLANKGWYTFATDTASGKIKNYYATISVTITNKVPNLTVSYATFGDGANVFIKPNVTRTFNVVKHVGQTPFVRIYQVGGGYLDFSLADKGKYAFRTDTASGKIKNFFA